MKASTKIIKFIEENGIFIVFGDYSNEEDFPLFLKFIEEKLGVTVEPLEEIVYLIIAEFQLDNHKLKAIFDDQFGSMIKVESNHEILADEIIKKCTV